MIIGKFQQENGGYVGTIPSLTGALPVHISPIEKKSEKAADHTVTVHDAEYGAAWTKTSAQGNEYLSIKIDTPFLPKPVNFALIKQSDGYALIWNRDDNAAKTQQAKDEAAA